MNICMCGAQSGYPHERYCPFPYYGGMEAMCARWELARESVLESVKANDEAIKREQANPCPPGFGPQGYGVND